MHDTMPMTNSYPVMSKSLRIQILPRSTRRISPIRPVHIVARENIASPSQRLRNHDFLSSHMRMAYISTPLHRALTLTGSFTMALATTKVALITGAARGIGRAIALCLVDDSLDVAVMDKSSSPELDGLVREIENKGRRSLAVRGAV
ncbi:hypothetical protein H4582DRAFT_1375700 [Lactarius indigo]|nr:hypothetical protein H4582DRAFT_1375700 [Lactarius indigo]